VFSVYVSRERARSASNTSQTDGRTADARACSLGFNLHLQRRSVPARDPRTGQYNVESSLT